MLKTRVLTFHHATNGRRRPSSVTALTRLSDFDMYQIHVEQYDVIGQSRDYALGQRWVVDMLDMLIELFLC